MDQPLGAGEKGMRAVRVIEGSTEFEFGEAPFGELLPHTARVKIEAAFLPTYFSGLPSGGWLTPQRPFTPGQCAIGIIEEIDPSITTLRVGQRVYCNMYVEGPGPEPDQAFIGCFGINPEAKEQLSRWPNGSFAEYFVGPEHCFMPIPDDVSISPEILCRLGWFATALAGFQRGGFRAGQVVAINGASGLLGASAALVACAIGAAEVRLIGRRNTKMKDIAALDPRITIEDPDDTRTIDFVLDCAGGMAAESTSKLIDRLKRFGTLTFVGGLTEPLTIQTGALMRNGNRLVGSFWFDTQTLRETVSLIASGAINLAPFHAETFGLEQVKEAMKHSLAHSGGLSHVALKP